MASLLWNVLDQVRPATGSLTVDLKAVGAALAESQLLEVLRFRDELRKELSRSRRWDLWGVGAILCGQLSPAFLPDFQIWLMAQGREFYEVALENPERIAERVPAGAPYLRFSGEAIIGEIARIAVEKGHDAENARGSPPASEDLQGKAWHWRELKSGHPRLWETFVDEPDRRAARPPRRELESDRILRHAAFPLDEWLDVHDDPEYLAYQQSRLRPEQVHLHALCWYELQVRNEGLHSFLLSEWGNLAPAVLQGLRALKCDTQAQALLKVADRLPGASIASSPEERRRQLTLAFPKGSADDLCDRNLIRGIPEALIGLVRGHLDLFFRPS